MTNYSSKSPAPSSPEFWLRTLDNIDGPDLPLVGGKAFRLAALKQHGLAVPSGLVLTTFFFETHLQQAQLVPLWAGSPDVAVTTEALKWLSDTLKTKPLSKELTQALNQALDNLFGPEVNSFAVRSSAIDEDQRDHTFAGVHLTELGVPRLALPIAITRCWASALDKPALDYRQAHGMSIQSIRLAVLIQPMLKPHCAGVGFTLNPLTGARDEFVIEATWGLGDALVSGAVQPYFYRVANQPPNYPVLEQTAPPAEQATSTDGPLSADELAELALHLERVQALMGEAQDVEWARHEGHFYMLQTRPVALKADTLPQADVEWTRGTHPEFLPELPSPLLNSVLERTQNRVSATFREMGFLTEGVGPYLKVILGRPYLNLTFLRRLISQLGLNSSYFLYTIGYTESGGSSSVFSIDGGLAWQKRGVYWRILQRIFKAQSALGVYRQAITEAVAALADFNLEAPLMTLLAQLRQHERIYGDFFKANVGIAIGLSAATALSSSLLATLTQTPATIVSTLASQGLKTIDSKLNRELRRLGQLAQKQPAIQKYLDSTALEEPPAEFYQNFMDLLAHYGQRANYELDLGCPRYQEDAQPLLKIIQRYAHTATPERSSNHEITWGQLWKQSTGLDRWLPWRLGLSTVLVGLLRRTLMNRDELNNIKAQAVAACRRWDLALGRAWVEQGWLLQADDIFWLTLEEIERALMVEEEALLSLSATVKARKETYRTYAETKMPFRLHESQIPLIQLGVGLTNAAPTDVLVGLPISPGQARGTVLVLHHPDEFQKIANDIILVTPSTDPAWLPLLHLASGLVVEMGGLLSHGSVIAREYGLPAVANIANATQQFRTGDSVLVDGSTGVVQILESLQDPNGLKTQEAE